MTPPRHAAGPEAARMPWWCSPAGIAAGFLAPLMLLITYVGETDHPGLTIRGVKMIDMSYLLLGLGLILGMAVAGWCGAQLQFGQAPDRARRPGANTRTDTGADHRSWDLTAQVIGGLAALAFVIWFRDFIFNPPLLWATLTGAFVPDRNAIELTPGLTSLANMAPVFFSIYAYRWFGLDASQRPIPRSMHALGIALGLLTLFRVYAWSERLAMIEMMVPFGVAAGRWMAPRTGAPWPLLRLFGPFAAIPLVMVFFGVAEYGRSWTNSTTYQGKLDFVDFVVGRFASYYYTSLNNGAGLLATTQWPTWKFEWTLEWLHHAPLGVGPLFSQLVGFRGSRFDWYLATYQDAEFNSPSGLYAVMSDMGAAGGLCYLLLIGLASGLCFRAYREGRFAGVLFYPIFFISYMEIYRYPYLGTARCFTWTLGTGLALLLALAFRRPHTRASSPSATAGMADDMADTVLMPPR